MKRLLFVVVLSAFVFGCNPDSDSKDDENTKDSIVQIEKAEKILEKAEEIEAESEDLEKKADSLLNSI